MKSLRGGVFDRKRFAGFVREQELRLLAFFVRRNVPPDEAEDLCQEAFLTFWKNRERAEAGKEGAFLFGIARNLLQAHFRKNGNRPVAVDPARIDLHRGDVSIPDPLDIRGNRTPVEDSDRRNGRIRKALSVLPLRQREVMELVWLEGLSRKEAAGRIGVSESTLRTHEERALARLRDENGRH